MSKRAYVVQSELVIGRPPPPLLKIKGLPEIIHDPPRMRMTLVIDAAADFTRDDITDAVSSFLAAFPRVPKRRRPKRKAR